jgi:CheY-like chemotaxis protein
VISCVSRWNAQLTTGRKFTEARSNSPVELCAIIYATEAPCLGAPLTSCTMSDRFAILIVDDNPDLVTSTAALLEIAGFKAIPAYSAREAVDLLDEIERIDLVLSDIRMPDVDGFDLLRVLRHRFPSLPIILMSGLPVTPDDVVPAGATILMKPFDLSQLQDAIKRKLAARRG